MGEVGDTSRFDIMGRPSLVAANLLRADPKAAARALFKPSSLSPSEARTIVREFGLGGGLLGTIFEALTDPLVVLGAILAYRFPVGSLKSLTRAGKQIAEADLRGGLLPPFLREVFTSPITVLRSTELWDPLIDVGSGRKVFLERHLPRLHEAAQKYEKKVGRPIDRFHQTLAVAVLDGMETQYPEALKYFKNPGINPATGVAWAKGSMRSPFDTKALGKYVDEAPGLRDFIRDARTVMDDLFDDMVIRHPEMREELQIALTKMGKRLPERTRRMLDAGIMESLDIPGDVRQYLRKSKRMQQLTTEIRESGVLELGEKLGEYWPHQLPRDQRDIAKDLLEIAHAVGRQRGFGQRVAKPIEATVTPNLLKRFDRMAPSLEDLSQFEGTGLLDKEAWGNLKGMMLEAAAAGPKRHVLQYSLNFEQVMQQYLHRAATTYAYNVRGAGRKLIEGIETLKKRPGGSQQIATVLENTLVPLVAGKPDFQRAVRGQYLAGLQLRLVGSLEDGLLSKALPGDLKKWMSAKLAKDPGPFRLASVEHDVADLLHVAALGAPNVQPSAFNALQVLLTTVPLLWTDAARGMGSVIRKGKRYFNMRVGGAGHHEALKEVFPEFVEMGLGGMSQLAEGAVDSLNANFRAAMGGPVRKGFNRINTFLMGMFRSVESFHQLTAFEGGMIKGQREGLPLLDRMLESRRVVLASQFPGGAENTSVFLSKLKGIPGGRLMTMFGQFATMFPEFLFSTATMAGSTEKAGLGGRNWGTLGRAMLVGGLAYEIGKGMGLDLSRGLTFGALPAPRENSAFYPLPFVPPALSIMGELGADVLKGELPDRTRYMLPLLVPGGVGIARSVGYYSPEAARALGRKYVDYDQPSPDGRYAVYSEAKRGQQTLVGYMTGMELVAQGLGLPLATTARKEPNTLGWLIGNRDRIRDYKRRWLAAHASNDPAKAGRLEREFGRAYPQVHGGLRAMVKPRDMEAVRMRRNVTRMERIMDTLPQEARPLFAMAIQQTVLGAGEEFLGIDPAMLSVGTARSRNVARTGGGPRMGRGLTAGQGRFGRGLSPYSRPMGSYRNTIGSVQRPEPREIARHELPNVTAP